MDTWNRRVGAVIKPQIELCDPFTMGKIIDEPQEHIGLYISLEKGMKPNDFVIVACDNSTGDCRVEEFDGVTMATFWLQDKRMEATCHDKNRP